MNQALADAIERLEERNAYTLEQYEAGKLDCVAVVAALQQNSKEFEQVRAVMRCYGKISQGDYSRTARTAKENYAKAFERMFRKESA